MDTKTNDEFRADIEKLDICMLATNDGTPLRSRSMAPHVDEKDGTIRFLTSEKTHKIEEVKKSPQANAVFVDDHGLYVSVSGRIRFRKTGKTSMPCGRRPRLPGLRTERAKRRC